MSLRIAFVGPIARPATPAKGGYEAANRRTIDLLMLRNASVVELRYPDANGPTWRKTLTYLRGYAGIAVQLFRLRHAWELMHITPLLRQFAGPELALVILARLLGKPVVIDIRAGDFLIHYPARSALYRGMLNAMTRLAGVVSIEGMNYQRHFETHGAKRILHFPNYVHWDDNLETLQRPKPCRPFRLLMLGRIVPRKGVRVGIETLRLLERTAPGQFSLTIIGSGESSYVKEMQDLAKGLPVTFSGQLIYSEARKLLTQAHVFLFPTVHIGEGHSNALTEAMAHGVVPICSDNGFSRAVVADTGFVLPKTATEVDYAHLLQDLSSAQLAPLSEAARARVRSYYSDTRVFDDLLAAYRTLVQ